MIWKYLFWSIAWYVWSGITIFTAIKFKWKWCELRLMRSLPHLLIVKLHLPNHFIQIFTDLNGRWNVIIINVKITFINCWIIWLVKVKLFIASANHFDFILMRYKYASCKTKHYCYQNGKPINISNSIAYCYCSFELFNETENDWWKWNISTSESRLNRMKFILHWIISTKQRSFFGPTIQV